LAKNRYSFADLAYSHAFIGKFETAVEELDRQKYFQPDNLSMLEGILTDSKLSCDYNDTSFDGDVNCGERDGAVQYKTGAVRQLHTDAGDFMFSSADTYRGNGDETNENASAVVVVVDPSDGGFGVTVEDHIAIVGGRHDAIAAALTLAASIIRLEDPNNRTKLSHETLHLDLEAAKSKTLFKKPTYVGDDAAFHKLSLAQALQMFDEADRKMGAQPGGAPAPFYQSEAHASHGGPLTKDQFQNLALGKTMGEVRAALGTPSNIDSNADGIIWFYWKDKLPVVDPDSGVVFASCSIHFDPDTKIAIRVGF